MLLLWSLFTLLIRFRNRATLLCFEWSNLSRHRLTLNFRQINLFKWWMRYFEKEFFESEKHEWKVKTRWKIDCQDTVSREILLSRWSLRQTSIQNSIVRSHLSFSFKFNYSNFFRWPCLICNNSLEISWQELLTFFLWFKGKKNIVLLQNSGKG